MLVLIILDIMIPGNSQEGCRVQTPDSWQLRVSLCKLEYVHLDLGYFTNMPDTFKSMHCDSISILPDTKIEYQSIQEGHYDIYHLGKKYWHRKLELIRIGQLIYQIRVHLFCVVM